LGLINYIFFVIRRDVFVPVSHLQMNSVSSEGKYKNHFRENERFYINIEAVSNVVNNSIIVYFQIVYVY